MNSGWVGDHLPNEDTIKLLRRRLRQWCPHGDLDGFARDAARIVAMYQSRRVRRPTCTEQRSAKRYFDAIAAGRSPRAKLPAIYQDEWADLVADEGPPRAAATMLAALASKGRGRPDGALDDWLIVRTSIAYRKRFGPRVGTGKNSRFAFGALPVVAHAAGFQGAINIGDRIATARRKWSTGPEIG